MKIKPSAEVSKYLSSISGGKSKSPKKIKAVCKNLEKAWKINRQKNKERKNEKRIKQQSQDGQ
jgi:hypothetical protein